MKKIRIISAILLVAWMGLIFYFSSQNATESDGTSGNLIGMIISIFKRDFYSLSDAERLELIAPFQFIVRKCAHFTIYGILGFFSFFTFITYKKINLKIRLLMISATCLLYSISDEFHQTFVVGRSGEIRDVIIDFSGSVLFIIILTLLSQLKRFKKYV